MLARLFTQRRDEAAVKGGKRSRRFTDEENEIESVNEICGEESWITRLVGAEEILEGRGDRVGGMRWRDDMVGHVLQEHTLRWMLMF